MLMYFLYRFLYDYGAIINGIVLLLNFFNILSNFITIVIIVLYTLFILRFIDYLHTATVFNVGIYEFLYKRKIRMAIGLLPMLFIDLKFAIILAGYIGFTMFIYSLGEPRGEGEY